MSAKDTWDHRFGEGDGADQLFNIDTVDLKLLAEIWSHSPDVSFIYPLGEERGFDAIEQNVFVKVMGGMFSARDLAAKISDLARRQHRWEQFDGRTGRNGCGGAGESLR